MPRLQEAVHGPTGTIFESSHLPISKWLLAIHLMCASKKGISAPQLRRLLDVTYRAAWSMNYHLRHGMTVNGRLLTKLPDVIEMDQTYVGVRHKRGTKRGRPGQDSRKAPVVALIERGGRVRVSPMPRVTSKNLQALRASVRPSSVLMTDEYNAYQQPGREFANHEAVNHSQGEYVGGDPHTNRAEGVFSLLKRGINFHHVGKDHLHRYCTEFELRHNTRMKRGYTDGERATILARGAEGNRLTYQGRGAADAA